MRTGTGIAASLAAVAVGAVLTYAITASTPGVSLPAVGTILMVIGLVGFVTSLYLDWSRRRSAAPPRGYEQYPPQAYGADYGQTEAYDPRRRRF
jgi:hypothetical protein